MQKSHSEGESVKSDIRKRAPKRGKCRRGRVRSGERGKEVNLMEMCEERVKKEIQEEEIFFTVKMK